MRVLLEAPPGADPSALEARVRVALGSLVADVRRVEMTVRVRPGAAPEERASCCAVLAMRGGDTLEVNEASRNAEHAVELAIWRLQRRLRRWALARDCLGTGG